MLLNRRNMSLFILLLAVACGHDPKVKGTRYASSPVEYSEEQSLTLENAAAREVQAKYYVEIEFDKGSSKLSNSAKKSLQAIIDKGNEAGEIDDLIVLSWSDSEYPSKNISKLSKAQRKLAKDRNKTIEKYAGSIADLDVDTYNMAEKPNALKKWFNTKDEKIKDSLVNAGLSSEPDANVFAKKASKALIMVKLEEKKY